MSPNKNENKSQNKNKKENIKKNEDENIQKKIMILATLYIIPILIHINNIIVIVILVN